MNKPLIYHLYSISHLNTCRKDMIATTNKKFMEKCMTASYKICKYAYNLLQYTISPLVY